MEELPLCTASGMVARCSRRQCLDRIADGEASEDGRHTVNDGPVPHDRQRVITNWSLDRTRFYRSRQQQ